MYSLLVFPHGRGKSIQRDLYDAERGRQVVVKVMWTCYGHGRKLPGIEKSSCRLKYTLMNMLSARFLVVPSACHDPGHGERGYTDCEVPEIEALTSPSGSLEIEALEPPIPELRRHEIVQVSNHNTCHEGAVLLVPLIDVRSFLGVGEPTTEQGVQEDDTERAPPSGSPS